MLSYSPAVKCIANQIKPQVINGSEVLVIKMKNPILQLANSSFYSSIFNMKKRKFDKNIIDPERTPLKASLHYWWNNGTYNITAYNSSETVVKESDNDIIIHELSDDIQSIEIHNDGSSENILNSEYIKKEESEILPHIQQDGEVQAIQQPKEDVEKENQPKEEEHKLLNEEKEEEKQLQPQEDEKRQQQDQQPQPQNEEKLLILQDGEKEKQSNEDDIKSLINVTSSLLVKENNSKNDEFDILNILHQILSADITDDLSYEFEDIEFKYGYERGLLLLSDKSLRKHNISTSFITINNAMDCFQYPEKFYFVMTSDLDISMFNSLRTIFGDKGILYILIVLFYSMSTVSNKFYWLQTTEDMVDYILDFVLMIVPIYIQLALSSRFINRSLTSSIKAIHLYISIICYLYSATTNRRFRFRYIIYACFDVFFTLGCIFCYLLFVVGSNADVTFLLVLVGFFVELFSLYLYKYIYIYIYLAVVQDCLILPLVHVIYAVQ